MNFAGEVVREQIANILRAWKMKAELIETTADAMVDSDMAGIDSHGIALLTVYEQKQLAGKLQLQAEPRIIRETAVTALIDAGAGLGHPASVMAARLAADKAAVSGIGAVGVNNSHHFGAAGYYAKMISDRGFLGLVSCNSRNVCVVPTRAANRVFGTNPIAFSAPARRNDAFLIDMATSTVAANKVRVYAYQGKPLPPGWVLDEHGEAVCDSKVGNELVWDEERGGLSPLGGTAEMRSHKGYGLAMMAQILGSTLVGGGFSVLDEKRGRLDKRDNLGHFFLAIDPKCFRPEGEFEDDVDEMIDFLHGQTPINPKEPVLVPGDPEVQSRKLRSVEGVPLSEILINKLRGICERSGAEFLLGESKVQDQNAKTRGA